jgi:hypothetical protein
MPDRHPSPRLTHTLKFRLSEAELERLAQQAEVQRMRITELARQLVTGKSRKPASVPALDPALVIQLQDIGVRLRDMLADAACAPDLRERIGALCIRIEQLIDNAISGGRLSWFR